MRTFHLTWMAFFLCFFGWFGLAPLMTVIKTDLGLTKSQIGNIIIASVAAASPPGGDELIVFLLDTSGSMQGEEQDMVDGVNTLLENMERTYESITSDQPKKRFNVHIWTFSESSTRLLMESTLAAKPRVTREQYVADGGTPLYDAIGNTLRDIPDNSTIVIATDGQDTTSSQFSRRVVSRDIKEAKEKRDIQFIFIAQGKDVFEDAQDMGFDDGPGTFAYAVPIGMSVGVAVSSNAMVTSVSTSAFRHVQLSEE